jgi:hypothetical protein
MIRTRFSLPASVLVVLLAATAPAFAGPPLVCFPFDTGGARTLPMGPGSWHTVDPHYDVSHLVEDTVALLTPATPVVARMETIRRATIYASANPPIAAALMTALQERAAVPRPDGTQAAFDFGYLVETYKQATWMFAQPVKAVDAIDGYQLVLEAAEHGGDPAMEFALAVITQGSTARSTEHREHVQRAIAGAQNDEALGTTITKHFRGTGELR